MINMSDHFRLRLKLCDCSVPSNFIMDSFPMLITKCYPCDVHGELIDGLCVIYL